LSFTTPLKIIRSSVPGRNVHVSGTAAPSESGACRRRGTLGGFAFPQPIAADLKRTILEATRDVLLARHERIAVTNRIGRLAIRQRHQGHQEQHAARGRAALVCRVRRGAALTCERIAHIADRAAPKRRVLGFMAPSRERLATPRVPPSTKHEVPTAADAFRKDDAPHRRLVYPPLVVPRPAQQRALRRGLSAACVGAERSAGRCAHAAFFSLRSLKYTRRRSIVRAEAP
jgi:hypothetical protein